MTKVSAMLLTAAATFAACAPASPPSSGEHTYEVSSAKLPQVRPARPETCDAPPRSTIEGEKVTCCQGRICRGACTKNWGEEEACQCEAKAGGCQGDQVCVTNYGCMRRETVINFERGSCNGAPCRGWCEHLGGGRTECRCYARAGGCPDTEWCAPGKGCTTVAPGSAAN